MALMYKNQQMKTHILLLMLLFGATARAQETGQQPESTVSTVSPFDQIKLFPNPTSEIIFIRNGKSIDSYQVISMQGQSVMDGVCNAQIISLIDVPSGYYFLELKIGEAIERFRIQKY
jgi:hypothetical protein